jgi:hypothetical protein
MDRRRYQDVPLVFDIHTGAELAPKRCTGWRLEKQMPPATARHRRHRLG